MSFHMFNPITNSNMIIPNISSGTSGSANSVSVVSSNGLIPDDSFILLDHKADELGNYTLADNTEGGVIKIMSNLGPSIVSTSNGSFYLNPSESKTLFYTDKWNLLGGGWTPYTQQGNKLVGDITSNLDVEQGWSLALSADGNTLAVGGPTDNGGKGSVWVFIRSGSIWTQESKLAGTGEIGNSEQGTSVSLSDDGNILAIGARGDNATVGAVWIFTRSGSTWTQQTKLSGTGKVGGTWEGTSIALSSKGDVLITGGPRHDGFKGAFWVYTNTAGVWSQLGAINTIPGSGSLGSCVVISSDGNTMATSGGIPSDAVVVYNRYGNTLVQIQIITPTGNVNPFPQYGSSNNRMSISSDGNVLAIGGDSPAGVWIWIRNGDNWVQQGSKISVNTNTATSQFQTSLSGDGNTLVVGAPSTNVSGVNQVGVALIYVYSNGIWKYKYKISGTGYSFNTSEMSVHQGDSIVISRDGRTLALGARNDDSSGTGETTGATWIFN